MKGTIILNTSCCVILAAGLSSRMGRYKPLLPVNGKPAIIHLISTMQTAGVDHCILVTGYRADDLMETCRGIDRIHFVHNPDYATTGMLESACIAFRSVPKECSRVLFTPGDIPLIPAAIVKELLAHKEPLIFPSYQMRKGHPVSIDASFLPDIISYKGEGGLRGALASLPVRPCYLTTDDPGVLMDMDTPQDYRRILSEAGQKNP